MSLPPSIAMPAGFAVGVDDDGQTIFEFEGFLRALGLELPAGIGAADPESTVEWVRGAGEAIASLAGFTDSDSAATYTANLLLFARSLSKVANVYLGAIDEARRGVQLHLSGGASWTAELLDEDGVLAGLLLDSTGDSDFASRPVPTAQIDDLAVTTAKLAALAVTAAKLAANSVETAKIVDAAVTAAKLAADLSARTEAETSADGLCTSPWEAYGSVYSPIRYYKDPFGRVNLRGLVKANPATNAAPTQFIFTLPAGYRPESGKRLIFDCLGHATNPALYRVDVSGESGSEGAVIYMGPYFGGSGNACEWLTLSGISFRAVT